MAYDSLGKMEQAYYWSIKNNKLMNEHYEDTRGTDIRITQLEAERKTQELENNYLRKKKAQDAMYNKQNRVISIVSVAVAIIMLVVVIGLYLQRKKLIETQQLLKHQKDQTEEKNLELTKFISVRDKLISVASHDLRAPLTTLKNLLQVFKYPDITQEEIQEAITMLEAQYERSIDMADNLLLWVKS
jgi:K+-sensing histidine kinase KdpD